MAGFRRYGLTSRNAGLDPNTLPDWLQIEHVDQFTI